jgi:hypothetical protein
MPMTINGDGSITGLSAGGLPLIQKTLILILILILQTIVLHQLLLGIIKLMGAFVLLLQQHLHNLTLLFIKMVLKYVEHNWWHLYPFLIVNYL